MKADIQKRAKKAGSLPGRILGRIEKALASPAGAGIFTAASILLAGYHAVFAAPTADKLRSNIENTLGPWLTTIAFFMAIVGIGQWAWGYLRNDPEGKTRGLVIVIGGAILGSAIIIVKALGF